MLADKLTQAGGPSGMGAMVRPTAGACAAPGRERGVQPRRRRGGPGTGTKAPRGARRRAPPFHTPILVPQSRLENERLLASVERFRARITGATRDYVRPSREPRPRASALALGRRASSRCHLCASRHQTHTGMRIHACAAEHTHPPSHPHAHTPTYTNMHPQPQTHAPAAAQSDILEHREEQARAAEARCGELAGQLERARAELAQALDDAGRLKARAARQRALRGRRVQLFALPSAADGTQGPAACVSPGFNERQQGLAACHLRSPATPALQRPTPISRAAPPRGPPRRTTPRSRRASRTPRQCSPTATPSRAPPSGRPRRPSAWRESSRPRARRRRRAARRSPGPSERGGAGPGGAGRKWGGRPTRQAPRGAVAAATDMRLAGGRGAARRTRPGIAG
jgi:hypothetical protein